MEKFSLSKISTRAPKKADKETFKAKTARLLEQLDELQYLLYAERKHALLVILQGMDAGGKDGAIRHVFGKLNPQGVQVQSFKVPTSEELEHDFLWRIHRYTPAKGMIRIFNRSHYEDVLVTRVHKLISDKTAHQRMEDINHFEKLLQHNGTHILKFYLHISKEEQAERLQERIDDPRKQWKYNANDFKERQRWHDYLGYYETVFERCGPDIPWTIVPADQNWYKEYVIARTVYDTLKKLHMRYPGLKG
ncbi:PPK2 family polyphosphate kinase [Compostibacter hankyongensis]|uniref:Polyphosphate kinase 2 family protein n=1 Tax=Compostibacter hankyongensis TaxID=1007089 RepID=A0ABP8FHY2_9BACT